MEAVEVTEREGRNGEEEGEARKNSESYPQEGDRNSILEYSRVKKKRQISGII